MQTLGNSRRGLVLLPGILTYASYASRTSPLSLQPHTRTKAINRVWYNVNVPSDNSWKPDQSPAMIRKPTAAEQSRVLRICGFLPAPASLECQKGKKNTTLTTLTELKHLPQDERSRQYQMIATPGTVFAITMNGRMTSLSLRLSLKIRPARAPSSRPMTTPSSVATTVTWR